MATNAERQRKLRQERRKAGLVPVTVYVPAHLQGEVMAMARQLCQSRHLELGPLKDSQTQRLVKRSL